LFQILAAERGESAKSPRCFPFPGERIGPSLGTSLKVSFRFVALLSAQIFFYPFLGVRRSFGYYASVCSFEVAVFRLFFYGLPNCTDAKVSFLTLNSLNSSFALRFPFS